MSQSFFKTKCPKCGHVASGSCGGLGLIGQETTTCKNPVGRRGKACGEVFKTHPNSFDWQNDDGDYAAPQPATEAEAPSAAKSTRKKRAAKAVKVGTLPPDLQRLARILRDPTKQLVVLNKRTGVLAPFNPKPKPKSN